MVGGSRILYYEANDSLIDNTQLEKNDDVLLHNGNLTNSIVEAVGLLPLLLYQHSHECMIFSNRTKTKYTI